MKKKLLMDKWSFRQITERKGWGCMFKEEEVTPRDKIETVTLYAGWEEDRTSLKRVLTTETKEAVSYQLRDMIRQFDDYLVEKELKELSKLNK